MSTGIISCRHRGRTNITAAYLIIEQVSDVLMFISFWQVWLDLLVWDLSVSHCAKRYPPQFFSILLSAVLDLWPWGDILLYQVSGLPSPAATATLYSLSLPWWRPSLHLPLHFQLRDVQQSVYFTGVNIYSIHSIFYIVLILYELYICAHTNILFKGYIKLYIILSINYIIYNT